MKRTYSLVIVLSLVALAGCGEHDHHEDHEQAEQEQSYYHEHEGLKLPDEVQQHLGIELALPQQKGSTNTLAVPSRAIIKAADANYIYVQRGDYLASVKVETGGSADGWTLITGGLVPGDAVVIRGAMDLRMIELLAIRGGEACCH